MTRDQLQKARKLLNLSYLSKEVGLTRSYIRTYLDAGREIPQDVQKRIVDVLKKHGLHPNPDPHERDEKSHTVDARTVAGEGAERPPKRPVLLRRGPRSTCRDYGGHRTGGRGQRPPDSPGPGDG